jgi:hypothetical protein
MFMIQIPYDLPNIALFSSILPALPVNAIFRPSATVQSQKTQGIPDLGSRHLRRIALRWRR